MNKNKNTNQNANAGITLIALIITIIVMLILVGVSVTIAIKGDLFGITKRAAKGTEKEKNAEQELANGRVKIDGVWYDSIEDYVGGNPSKDQKESNIKFAYEPKGWTKGPVKVKIEAEGIEGTLQYSMDGVTWENYTEEIEVANNGTKIYAKVMGSEEEVETVVETIDKEAPEITTALNSPSQTTVSINIAVGVTDSVSGISKIEWYYKISEEDKYTKLTEDTYADINGEKAGNRSEVKVSKEISGLEKGTTYNIYVVVYDVAGNKAESVLEQQTIESLLGRYARIGEEDYIVLYEPGDKIKIGETEYEIKDAQLISANVLWPDDEGVHLGYNDGQIDWTNADVIKEADLIEEDGTKDGTLDNVEKAAYSYNHAIETLNKKCYDLVKDKIPGIKESDVRSVGSNPIYPNSENKEVCEEDYLLSYPSGEAGKYYKVGKWEDENYKTDYNRMNLLGMLSADGGGNYWLASRHSIYQRTGSSNISFFIRYINVSSTNREWQWSVAINRSKGYDKVQRSSTSRFGYGRLPK